MGLAFVGICFSLKSFSYGNETICCFLFQNAFGIDEQRFSSICFWICLILSSICFDFKFSSVFLYYISFLRNLTCFCFC